MRFDFSLELAREDVAIGIVVVGGVTSAPACPALSTATEDCIRGRRAPLDPTLEARRLACRDMLRNGTYKPTGRAKPASEYLLRAAGDGSYPAINGLVDANNLVSLEHMLPISTWDVDLAGTKRFHFRLGAEGESYVFNAGGQSMDLRDLLVGCGVPDGTSVQLPMVNPVKDSLGTKTTTATRNVAAAIYCPLFGGLDVRGISRIAAELLDWLRSCGDGASGACGVLLPHGRLSLETGDTF